ncbi:MAG: hypothetical protein KDE33_05645 [Bacteroidetes bacterium]|nr:hypothetical protein [Bacteroidota bacterium]
MEEAIKAVNLLSDAAKGRANFFVLDEFRHFKPSQPVLGNELKPVLELIEVDEKYQQLAAYLLDNTYYISNEDETEKILADKKYNNINLLTSSGKFIKRSFAVSGGAVGLFEGKRIGRAKNLDKLQKELKVLEKEAAGLQKNVLLTQDKLDAVQNKTQKEALETKQQEVSKLNLEFKASETRLENLKSFFESNIQKSKNVNDAIDRIVQENKAMVQEQKDLSNKREELRTTVEKSDSFFVELTDKLNQTSSAFNQNNILFHQEQNKLQNLKQELAYIERDQQNLKENNERNETLLVSTKQNIENYTQQLKEIESSLLQGYSNKEKIEENVVKAEEDYYKSRGNINELETELKKIVYNKQQAEQILQNLREKFTDLKLELNSIKERLSIEFNVNVNDIINEEITSELNEQELEEKVVKIKNRIDTYGEINPMAVEAYDEMKQRYDFITTQITDLNNAKESLLETIDEIEEKAQGKFMEAFTEVRANFQNVFRTLFTEDDKCDLILLDEDNPLESKIDIIAKPKGKRPQIIDQLSGGEKTLTATALLFSLYLLKPAPFCIFDEVDAPLDDTNIDKFNKIIQEFSKESQFIIVTHNKQTMSHVDVIYGVTMQEPGVSKVVPVDFRALKED